MEATPGRIGTVLAAAASFVLVALVCAPVSAQDRGEWTGSNLSAEARIGVTFPVADLGDRGAESGLAVGADLIYNFLPNWSAYGGWSFHDFNCDGCPDDLESSGPHIGAKYIFLWEGAALPWVRGGLLFGQAEDFRDGTDVQADRTVGLEAATGIDMRIAERLSLVPTLWLTHYTAEFPGDDLGMTYFVADVGVHYHF